jgi:hypothetical protein
LEYAEVRLYARSALTDFCGSVRQLGVHIRGGFKNFARRGIRLAGRIAIKNTGVQV